MGQTPLMRAVSVSGACCAAVRVLLEAGADAQAKDRVRGVHCLAARNVI